MNRPKFHVKKGDHVQVITGNHRGAKGKSLAVLPAKSQVIIEGVRLIKKHTRRSQENQQGGIIDRDMPVDASNLMLVHKGKPTRVGYRVNDDGTKVRIAKRSGAQIDQA